MATTEQEAESFASLYKTSFGRAMTTTDAKVYLREVRESCQASNEEVRAAMRTIAANMLDDHGIHPPTAPALAREIRHIRGRTMGGAVETFDQAIERIAAEPDQSLRYSMFCNRGGSDALADAMKNRGIEMAVYGPGHPDWAWAVELQADEEWRSIRLNMEDADKRAGYNGETEGERLARKDSFSRAFLDAFGRQVAKRAKEGWAPPAMDALSPPIATIMGSMARAAESNRKRMGAA